MSETTVQWPVSSAAARVLLAVILAAMAGSISDTVRAFAGARDFTVQGLLVHLDDLESDRVWGR
jgi:hypothetical protein